MILRYMYISLALGLIDSAKQRQRLVEFRAFRVWTIRTRIHLLLFLHFAQIDYT